MILLIVCLTLLAPTSTGKPLLSADQQTITVIGLDRAWLPALQENDGAKLAEVLTVRVGTGIQEAIAARTPIPGTVTVEATSDGFDLRFTPRFPFSPGVPYQVTFDPTRVDGTLKPTVRTLTVPKPKPSARVSVVYPKEDELPENLLRFYIHFSKPMSKGDAYSRVRLLDAKGKRVQYPFLELAEELWSEDGQRFTLLLDPGRVKRHLMPREVAGAVFVSGKEYTLVVDKSWQDRDGVPMTETYKKTFIVTPARQQAIDPKEWTLMLPNKDKPFRVRFDQSIDHALASRMMWVIDASGTKHYGQLSEKQPLVWQLDSALEAGPCQLVIDTRLEDPCGNRIGQAFEVDLLEPIPERATVKTISLPFTVPK